MFDAFLLKMRADPDDSVLRMVVADWLEEQGDRRGELLRLTHLLTHHLDHPERAAQEARARELVRVGVRPVGPWWTNSIGMEFVWVPAGCFTMGSPPAEPGRNHHEALHRVRLSRGFYMGVFPVTQQQWQTIMGRNPSHFLESDRPVECVSWQECQEFCLKLARRDDLDVNSPSPYRLPTEAEWEYACRGGMSSPFFFGESLTASLANYHTNYGHERGPQGKYRQETTPVGCFPANSWGLSDMHGNVFEWCADAYAPYNAKAATDPIGQGNPEVRVLRGGSWKSLMSRCGSASRGWTHAGYRGIEVGFRVCFRLDHDYAI
jgi:uncharacterized protein (TIGR02996 family)